MTSHVIFLYVILDLTKEYRYVADGHLDPPSFVNYASIFIQDSVLIAFIIAALNDLGVLYGLFKMIISILLRMRNCTYIIARNGNHTVTE